MTDTTTRIYLRDFNFQGGEPAYLETGGSIERIIDNGDGTSVLMLRSERITTPLDVENAEDTTSSASRQHFIDTGTYLRNGEAHTLACDLDDDCMCPGTQS
jgi:hypothetical protein